MKMIAIDQTDVFRGMQDDSRHTEYTNDGGNASNQFQVPHIRAPDSRYFTGAHDHLGQRLSVSAGYAIQH